VNIDIAYRDVSRETWSTLTGLCEQHEEQLEAYLDQLLWWNQKTNLVSRNADRTLIRRHIEHSLLPLALELLTGDLSYFDAGTGGGLPGIPLAIANKEDTYWLNDINFKKITAVHQIAASLGLQNIHTRRGSYEEVYPDEPFVLISKHSFKTAPLFRFFSDVDLCREIILYKGDDFKDEIDHLPGGVGAEAYSLEPHAPGSFYTDKYILRFYRLSES
jgi:16S rRNA (guanine527-N7)-methyltransferase